MANISGGMKKNVIAGFLLSLIEAWLRVWMGGGGVWYSLFIKNLAHYSSHLNFGLFIEIRPFIH